VAIQNRYDFILLFDVTDGNPNGDPDGSNLPRIDVQTGHGIVTDVCLKRKIRNYVGLVKNEQPPYEIYIKEKAVLNQQHQRAYQALNLQPTSKKEGPGVREWMCQNFFDIRTFGAVMTTDTNCGQVRGPVQLTFARSIDPIVTSELRLSPRSSRVGTGRWAESLPCLTGYIEVKVSSPHRWPIRPALVKRISPFCGKHLPGCSSMTIRQAVA
jgi:CRISPR-associated protein Cas7/Csd2 subtype I-C